MDIFDLISLFGGLAMFLYGMRIMGTDLREGASGTLKAALEKVTNSSVKAFFLGLVMTAVIQSSTATIVITAGLVGAGLLTLHQSLGILIGANVGTTVTGQIIRLLDINASGSSLLRFFTPATLAPLALIAGVVILMSGRKKHAEITGGIIIGFGLLFSGLLNMTGAVNSLSETGLFDSLFARLHDGPQLGYAIGAAVAFILQSSSATIGILQAFALTGSLTFSSVYSVIVGIYLGDCVTTAIVCSIGAKPEAKRVGLVNILFNLSETVVVLAAVAVIHRLGLLDGIWNATIRSGGIANTNTIFNLGCAIVLFPMLPVYERLSRILIPDKAEKTNVNAKLVDALSPAFFDTPALAFRSCYNVMCKMLDLATGNFYRAVSLLRGYSDEVFENVLADEDAIDYVADRVGQYLAELSPHIKTDAYVGIFDEYNKVVPEFERLGDHAMNIAEHAQKLSRNNVTFSAQALRENEVLTELIGHILELTENAFKNRDLASAKQIEPLEEVVDDLNDRLRDAHLIRLRSGSCSVSAGICFLDVLTDMERISDVCSNVGLAVVVRTEDRSIQPHDYVAYLHEGNAEWYNTAYRTARDLYFKKLEGTASDA